MAEAPLSETLSVVARRGWLTADAFPTRQAELDAVRAVARDALGAGRVFDGHRNALERLTAHRPSDVPVAVREVAAAGDVLLGVWGADPSPGEGPAATLSADGTTLTGVKTFCSGAGFVDHAIVLVRREAAGPPTLPVLVAVDPAAPVQIDRTWFTAPAIAESHSHRVEFTRTPVLAVLGTNGTLSAEPWLSGDALRSTAVWAGAADALLRCMLAMRAGGPDGHERLGRAAAIVAGVDAWLAAGLSAVMAAHEGGPSPWGPVAAMRLELTERLRELLRLVAEHGGSRALVHDDLLHQARGGLDLLLLQHRLGGAARRLGEEAAGVRDD